MNDIILLVFAEVQHPLKIVCLSSSISRAHLSSSFSPCFSWVSPRPLPIQIHSQMARANGWTLKSSHADGALSMSRLVLDLSLYGWEFSVWSRSLQLVFNILSSLYILNDISCLCWFQFIHLSFIYSSSYGHLNSAILWLYWLWWW